MIYPHPRYLWHWRTELAEVPGIWVWLSYRKSTSSGYGYECPTELTEVFCRVIPGVSTPGLVCPYPTGNDLNIIVYVLNPSMKHFASCAKNLFISRAITPQGITFAGGCGIIRGWGTGTSIFSARPSAQAAVLAMIQREKRSLDRKECGGN